MSMPQFSFTHAHHQHSVSPLQRGQTAALPPYSPSWQLTASPLTPPSFQLCPPPSFPSSPPHTACWPDVSRFLHLQLSAPIPSLGRDGLSLLRSEPDAAGAAPLTSSPSSCAGDSRSPSSSSAFSSPSAQPSSSGASPFSFVPSLQPALPLFGKATGGRRRRPTVIQAAGCGRRAHGSSCHQCKTTLPARELLCCTNRPDQRKTRRCRKKYCRFTQPQ